MTLSAPQTPPLGAFSDSATRKAVLGSTLQHPLTLFPVAVGVLGAVGVVLFNAPTLAIGAAVAGLSTGFGAWCVNYIVRNKTFANRYVESLRAAMEKQRAFVLQKIRSELMEASDVPGAKEYVDQGSSQFRLIQACFESLKSILGEKLNQGELTYMRYLGTAEQVYLAVLDNLQDIATLLKTVRAIDFKHIEERLDSLKKMDKLAETDRLELETLEKRMTLRQTQMDKINALLTVNERAMTEIDQTTAAIAAVRTTQGRATTDMESALTELEQLAKRSSKYTAT